MINESEVIDLVTGKIWQAIQNKHSSPYQRTLVPQAHVYEMMGRRGFHKNETRLLGHFFESRGLVKVSKHGWLIKPTTK